MLWVIQCGQTTAHLSRAAKINAHVVNRGRWCRKRSYFKRLIKLLIWLNFHYFCRVLGSTLNEGHYIIGDFPAYYLFNGLLLVLQVLNVFWFCTIFRMVYLAVITGQVRLFRRMRDVMATTANICSPAVYVTFIVTALKPIASWNFGHIFS